MKNRSHAGEVATAVAIIWVCVEIGVAGSVLSAREPALSTYSEARRQCGPFDVKLVPQGTPDKAEGSTLARMSLNKQYHGDLEATAKGEMLTAGTDVQGSAGYVAIDRITGTLNGRTGSFVLQHSGKISPSYQIPAQGSL